MAQRIQHHDEIHRHRRGPKIGVRPRPVHLAVLAGRRVFLGENVAEPDALEDDFVHVRFGHLEPRRGRGNALPVFSGLAQRPVVTEFQFSIQRSAVARQHWHEQIHKRTAARRQLDMQSCLPLILTRGKGLNSRTEFARGHGQAHFGVRFHDPTALTGFGCLRVAPERSGVCRRFRVAPDIIPHAHGCRQVRCFEPQIEPVDRFQGQRSAKLVNAQAHPGKQRFDPGRYIRAAGNMGEDFRPQQQTILRPLGPEDRCGIRVPALLDHPIVMVQPAAAPILPEIGLRDKTRGQRKLQALPGILFGAPIHVGLGQQRPIPQNVEPQHVILPADGRPDIRQVVPPLAGGLKVGLRKIRLFGRHRIGRKYQVCQPHQAQKLASGFGRSV